MLWIVAAFVVPEIVKKLKPMAKVVGEVLVNTGESLKRSAEQKDECAVCVVAEVVEPEATAEPEVHEEPAPKKKGKTTEAAE